MGALGAPPVTAPEGITNPPIDDLLNKVSSKYALVEHGPREKPRSIAWRAIHASLLEHAEGE